MITGLCDNYPQLLRRNREVFVAVLIAFIYLCSLPTTTNVCDLIVHNSPCTNRSNVYLSLIRSFTMLGRQLPNQPIGSTRNSIASSVCRFHRNYRHLLVLWWGLTFFSIMFSFIFDAILISSIFQDPKKFLTKSKRC